jgi:hypothetical protein
MSPTSEMGSIRLKTLLGINDSDYFAAVLPASRSRSINDRYRREDDKTVTIGSDSLASERQKNQSTVKSKC